MLREDRDARLNGMWAWPPSDSLAMTVPNVSRLLLMKDPSVRWPFVTVTWAAPMHTC